MNRDDAFRAPSLLLRKAVAKVRRHMVSLPESPIQKRMPGGIVFEHVRLPFLDEEDQRAMLTQTYDIILCDCLRRHLDPDAIVLDVGANIGYIAAIAASCLGPNGEVHAFEPLAECFERLQAVQRLNPEFHFHMHNVALGAEKGSLPIAFDPRGEMRNATLVPGTRSESTRVVPVWRLDDYIFDAIAQPERIGLIKIDVEGFEFAVLQGLERFMQQFRPPIVCEIKHWEIKKLGYTMRDFAAFMDKFEYRAFDMISETRVVDIEALRDLETVLFKCRAGSAERQSVEERA